MARNIETRSGPSSARAWLPSQAYAAQPNQIRAMITRPWVNPRSVKRWAMDSLTAVIA